MAGHADAEHSSAGKYIQIAVVLFALTALEVALYEVCYGGLKAMAPGLGASLEPWFVELLLLLSAFKFWFVAMFYMHLKFDMKLLSWLFLFSLIIAVIVIGALIVLFGYNRGLWWPGGKW
jgi:cytochrome c oxidase subunit IV